MNNVKTHTQLDAIEEVRVHVGKFFTSSTFSHILYISTPLAHLWKLKLISPEEWHIQIWSSDRSSSGLRNYAGHMYGRRSLRLICLTNVAMTDVSPSWDWAVNNRIWSPPLTPQPDTDKYTTNVKSVKYMNDNRLKTAALLWKTCSPGVLFFTQCWTNSSHASYLVVSHPEISFSRHASAHGTYTAALMSQRRHRTEVSHQLWRRLMV